MTLMLEVPRSDGDYEEDHLVESECLYSSKLQLGFSKTCPGLRADEQLGTKQLRVKGVQDDYTSSLCRDQ